MPGTCLPDTSPRHAMHVFHPRDRIIAANFLAAYTWFQRQSASCTVCLTDGMVCAHAPGGLTDFNVALPDASAELPCPESDAFRRGCVAAQAFFAPFRAPFSCWVPGDSEALAPERLGFTHRAAYTGQYLDLQALCDLPASGLNARRVETLADLEAFAYLIALGWSMPTGPYRSFFADQADCLLPSVSSKQFFLGFAGDRPACCMELFVQPEAGVAGIYYVTTHPDCRRQGFAAAMQSQVLRQAASQGYTSAVVVSEPDECRLLHRLGFENCATWHEYS